ncbi:MAG: tRNA 2-thiouridine(34) synthase MnmA [Candidatus Fraserbacteria bacterium RBG_16_55_9]|uniref:tRNA-specific 2-thiouridylase MnmA n=1 Tax=Fraserbacteria sp. (strain RBG_16_55_9) TaxID=1817864 RepID=A0A1F5UPL4_FRAXR|nr:MAG: tRNA 2-thiouridine(34) synthase MnmA [Candidatus Fraserbacteria bacterium RBG_16_55_9]
MSRGRVLVAMSGGVDSSVAALLLLQEGYQVIGATLNLWSYEGRQEPYNECCSLEVRVVAQQLGIVHHFIDEGDEFKKRVVDPFIADYLAGRTPSPCARCNRHVRFPKLLELAGQLGCEYLATGHHARIQHENGTYHLLQGHDPMKDQSYFLYALEQSQLERILFPVGDYRKEEVWEIARRHDLVSARKPESQDLCFLPHGDHARFLKERANGSLAPGEIVDAQGRVLGQHQGLAFYTVGQRKGLGLSTGEKVYITALDPVRNRLVVGSEEALYAGGLLADEVHFIALDELTHEERVEVKVRYRCRPTPATLHPDMDSRVQVLFDEPQRAITPGQIAVFYQAERVLGGGTIVRALTPDEARAYTPLASATPTE